MVRADRASCLLDCGATTLIAMRRYGIDPTSVDAIFLSHLHGDHFAGLPFLLLQQHFVAARSKPLVIAGPAGTEQRLIAALDVLFPGSAGLQWRFPVSFAELSPGRAKRFGPFAITPHVVNHPSGSTAFAFRLKTASRLIAYSGDTEWTDELISVGRDADLMILECYAFRGRREHHMDYQTLRGHLHRLQSKRILLTHLSGEMLDRLADVDLEVAEDGQLVEL